MGDAEVKDGIIGWNGDSGELGIGEVWSFGHGGFQRKHHVQRLLKDGRRTERVLKYLDGRIVIQVDIKNFYIHMNTKSRLYSTMYSVLLCHMNILGVSQSINNIYILIEGHDFDTGRTDKRSILL